MDRSCSSDDKVFQAAGPDVENARGSNVDVSVLGTTSWLSCKDFGAQSRAFLPESTTQSGLKHKQKKIHKRLKNG